MSDLTSVDSASGTASSASSCNTPSATRPQHRRKHSYTHVFPASSVGTKLGNPARKETRESDIAASTNAMDERTRMFFSGLDWLLDASTQPDQSARRPSRNTTPLSKKAVTSFNACEDDRRHSAQSSDTQKDSKSTKTARWIECQIETKPSAPF